MRHLIVFAVIGVLIWLVVRARSAGVSASASAEPRLYEPRRTPGPKVELAVMRGVKRILVVGIKIAAVVICFWLLVKVGLPLAYITGPTARALFQGLEEFHR